MSDTIQQQVVQKTVDERKGGTSASAAKADSLCKARHLMQKGVPEPERSADAARGDRIHRALAQTNEAPFDMPSLSVEERDVFDSCREIEKGIIQQYFGDTTQGGLRVFREQRYWVSLNHQGKPIVHSGRADMVARHQTRALITDYKTLAGDVEESPRNEQLRDLAVLVRGHFVTIEEVACAIIQPLVTHKPVLCVYTAADLDKARDAMYDRIIASNTAGQEPTPGEIQCQFCRAKGLCAPYQKWAGTLVPALQSVLDVPMANWTPEQTAFALDRCGLAEDFIDRIKSHAKELLQGKPDAIPGWGLKPGAIRETITDPQVCFDRFNKLGGKLEQFLPTITISKGKLAESVATVTGAKGAALKAAIKTLTEGIVEVKQNAPSLKKREEDAK